MNTALQARVYASHIGQHAGEQVTLSGWLHRLRQLRNVSFLILRDRTGIVQCVLEDAALVETVANLHMESIVTVTGTVSTAPDGKHEVHAAHVAVIEPSSAPPTFDLFRPNLKAQLPTLLDHAAVALRHPRQRAHWQLAAASMAGFRSTLNAHAFTEIQTPKIVGAATESGANVFAIDYFGTQAYLAQSPQFYKQMMVGIYERVFEVGPVFRAEPHATSRHLTQYTSLDAEFGFIEDHFAVMAMLREVLAGMIASIQATAPDALAALELDLPAVPPEIPHLHFTEAKALYAEAHGTDEVTEPDLSPSEERWLGEWAATERGSDFLFITGYPMSKRPFYTHTDPARPDYSNSFDLLFRGLELVTGGQRLHRYADYLAAMEQWEVDPAPLEGYLMAFKHGMPPHGGFAIGLERWVSRLTSAQNVREAALFPRDMTRLTP